MNITSIGKDIVNTYVDEAKKLTEEKTQEQNNQNKDIFNVCDINKIDSTYTKNILNNEIQKEKSFSQEVNNETLQNDNNKTLIDQENTAIRSDQNLNKKNECKILSLKQKQHNEIKEAIKKSVDEKRTFNSREIADQLTFYIDPNKIYTFWFNLKKDYEYSRGNIKYTKKKRTTWTKEENVKFNEYFEKNKDCINGVCVDWEDVAKYVGTRDLGQCRSHWQAINKKSVNSENKNHDNDEKKVLKNSSNKKNASDSSQKITTSKTPLENKTPQKIDTFPSMDNEFDLRKEETGEEIDAFVDKTNPSNFSQEFKISNISLENKTIEEKDTCLVIDDEFKFYKKVTTGSLQIKDKDKVFQSDYLKKEKLTQNKDKIPKSKPSFSKNLPYEALQEITLPLDSNHPLIKNLYSESIQAINKLIASVYNGDHLLLKGLFDEQKQIVQDIFTAWLHDSSVLLSPPMGAGKTRITTTLLKLKFEIESIRGGPIDDRPNLIVAPINVIKNWENELTRGVINEEHLRINQLFKEFLTTRITPSSIYEVLIKTGYILKEGKDSGKDLNDQGAFNEALSPYFPLSVCNTIRENLIFYRSNTKGAFQLTQGFHFSSIPYIKGEKVWQDFINKGCIDNNGNFLKNPTELEKEIDALSFVENNKIKQNSNFLVHPNQHPYAREYKDFLKQILLVEKQVWQFLSHENVKIVLANGQILESPEKAENALKNFKIIIYSPDKMQNLACLSEEHLRLYLKIFQRSVKYTVESDKICNLHSQEFSKKNKKIFIVNPEAINPLMNQKKDEKKIVSKFFDEGFSFIICDEAQKLKTLTTEFSQRIREIGKASKYRLNVSATPLELGLEDVLNGHSYLNPDAWSEDEASNIFAYYQKKYDKITQELQYVIENLEEGTTDFKKTTDYLKDEMRELQSKLVGLANNLAFRTIRSGSKIVESNQDPRTCPPERIDLKIQGWIPSDQQKELMNGFEDENSKNDSESSIDNTTKNSSISFKEFRRITEHPLFQKRNELYIGSIDQEKNEKENLKEKKIEVIKNEKIEMNNFPISEKKYELIRGIQTPKKPITTIQLNYEAMQVIDKENIKKNISKAKTKDKKAIIEGLIKNEGLDNFINASGILKHFIKLIENCLVNKYSKDIHGRYVKDENGIYPAHIVVLTESVPLTLAMNSVIGKKLENVLSYIFSGDQNMKEREEILSNFNQPEEKPKILFLNKKSGAVGINLTYATFLINLIPDYNPLLDAQAYGRPIRTGNKAKQVEVMEIECNESKYSLDSRRKRAQAYRLVLAELFNNYQSKAADFKWILDLFLNPMTHCSTNMENLKKIKRLRELFESYSFDDQLEVKPFKIEKKNEIVNKRKRETEFDFEDKENLKKQKIEDDKNLKNNIILKRVRDLEFDFENTENLKKQKVEIDEDSIESDENLIDIFDEFLRSNN